MTSESQTHQSSSSSTAALTTWTRSDCKFSPAPPPAVTATSITELLNSNLTTEAPPRVPSPASSCSMTTVVPSIADVPTPCTSSGGNTFRASSYIDANKQCLPLITPVTNSGNATCNSRPSANGQAPFHNQFCPQQHDQAGSVLVNVRGKTDPAMAPYICAKCNKKIVDRYLLEALEKYWHEDCLKCDACDGRLGELGSKLYFKNNSILCQRDYLRIFRPTGTCAACTKTIPAFEQVMRAGTNVYHLECFACQECNHRFCIGDKFYLDVDHNKILCEYDYEERLVFAQMAYNYNSLAQLKRQISQQVDDFDEVQSVPPR